MSVTRAKHRGFTLVEVLVVVVIIGVLSGLAVPRFITLMGENQLDGDFSALAQDINWARTQSIKTGKPYQVDFTNTEPTSTGPLGWMIREVDPTTGTLTLKSNQTAGVSIRLGLPENLGPRPFQGAGQPVDGLGTALDKGRLPGNPAGGSVCSETAGGTESWANGIRFCGGAVGETESGALFLQSTRSNGRAYVLFFNRTTSLVPQKLRYMGSEWETF